MMNIIQIQNIFNTIVAWSVIVGIVLLVSLLSFYFFVFTGRIKLRYTSIDEKCRGVCHALALKKALDYVLASKIESQFMEDAFIQRVVNETLRIHGSCLLSSDNIHEAKERLAWIARKFWWIHVGAKAKRELQSSHMGKPS